MRKHLLGLMLIAGLAACSSDTESDIAASDARAIADPMAASGLPTDESLAALRGSATSFASLPDRGELMAYGGARKSHRSGAYTYHPVALSEAHAFNAIGTGEMVLATPDGQELRVKYQSHEEHPDGNWSWIGRNADGSSAVLTFGEKAVFGLVTRGDDQYRVRTDRTGAWVVETDRNLLPTGKKERPDSLLPPEEGMLAAAAIRHLEKAAAAGEVSAKAAAVVDVLLGYSTGLAQTLGSQSAAQTRMLNLIALTNMAYANSGVNMRLRAVHGLQVNYGDSTDNEETLQQLTGYNATTRESFTPNAAFNELRAARDTYGADLVAFVRRYREPEQNGCGIAWLLGMNQSGIQAARDAEFGYAVISDGTDPDEGDGQTYFCSDFALAHELGHVMGQAHNTENAAGRAGAHTYSYGYREASASGFFTIMAYPLGEAQLEIPHFANPAVRYQNRVTGTAAADNVRSMNATMPIVSGFRATVVPAAYIRNDVNANGFGDLLWMNAGTRQFAYWLMSGANRTGSATIGNLTAGYSVAATGDFNADGRADVLWANPTAGALYLWTGNASGRFQSQFVSNYPAGWTVVGTGDANLDGKSDIYWFNSATRQLAYWLMDGNKRIGSKTISNVTAGFTVGAVADFNRDGRDDVLWVNTTTRVLYMGLANASGTYGSAKLPSYPAGWQIAGTGDVNGDGLADILWTNPAGRQFGYWQMAGTTVSKSTTINNITAGYTIATVTDFNGDGRDDVVWVHTGQRQMYLWLMTAGGGYSSKALGTYPAGWSIIR